jgi:hypothetical protein
MLDRICDDIGMGNTEDELLARREAILYCQDIMSNQQGVKESKLRMILSSFYDGFMRAHRNILGDHRREDI